MSEEKNEPSLQTFPKYHSYPVKRWRENFKTFISTYGTSEAKDLDTQDYIIIDGKIYINKKKILGEK